MRNFGLRRQHRNGNERETVGVVVVVIHYLGHHPGRIVTLWEAIAQLNLVFLSAARSPRPRPPRATSLLNASMCRLYVRCGCCRDRRADGSFLMFPTVVVAAATALFKAQLFLCPVRPLSLSSLPLPVPLSPSVQSLLSFSRNYELAQRTE